MTAKEKAKDLLHKFYFSLPNNGGFTGLCNINQRWEEGKICALIAIDELIRVTPWGDNPAVDEENGSKHFYINVKQELEKL